MRGLVSLVFTAQGHQLHPVQARVRARYQRCVLVQADPCSMDFPRSFL